MTRASVLAVLILAGFASAQAQAPVQVPDKPLSPKAGRVLQLKEDLRITDESGQFFLKYPGRVRVAPDGSLYFSDAEQIIHLDAKGGFLANLFHKGQGPGELNYSSDLVALPGGVLIHGTNPSKLVRFDARDKLVSDVSLRDLQNWDLIGRDGDRLLGCQMHWPASSTKYEIRMTNVDLISIAPDGEAARTLFTFPVRILTIGGAGMWDGYFLAPLPSRRWALSHTKEYSIKIIDLAAPNHPLEILRTYKKVLRPSNERRGGITTRNGTKYELPGSEYLADISALFAYRNVLWVQTSTKDPDKGILFDVYDPAGRYVDAFFLKTEGRLLDVQGDALFIRESAPDDSLRIVRYRVVE